MFLVCFSRSLTDSSAMLLPLKSAAHGSKQWIHADLIAHGGLKRRFHVYHAANGSEAASRIHQSKIDLVITDVMMFLVTGPELGAWVRYVWPHISVLLVLAFFHPLALS
jgi:CheY-like chemotaxis protein